MENILGKRIKELREDADIKQLEFSKILNIMKLATECLVMKLKRRSLNILMYPWTTLWELPI